MPDGHSIQLRELIVRPRAPRSNVVVGSLWFDVSSGQLVRAAYRPAAPSEGAVSVTRSDTAKPLSIGQRISLGVIRSMLSPSTANVSWIAVEYGLYEGRFWLPRLQSTEASARASFARATVRYENSFTYASVNGRVSVPSIPVDTSVSDADAKLSPRARRDSLRTRMRIASLKQCDSGATRTYTEFRERSQVPVQITVPCDLDKLAQSADLPASAYDSGDEIFNADDRDRVIGDALRMTAQAPFSLGLLPPPHVQFGPSMSRYNRIEGFSTGLLAEQQVGAGYSARGIVRFGFADRVVNGELSLARTNASTTVRLAGYRRLVAANDWGNPLSFGSSVSALLSGRDDGFYYRATGAELSWNTVAGTPLEWRAFVERQRIADQHTTFSVASEFTPNIVAANVRSAGASVRALRSFGVDPRGLRTFVDVRLEGAGGDSTYGRGAADVTVSRSFAGTLATALTIAAGTSVGGLPVQRRWFLGGAHTIRGQSPDSAQSGNAFWLGRLELAKVDHGVRASLFGDLGWTGDRAKFTDVVRPLSGAGVGVSAFDGLIRADLARGIYPLKQTRLYLYLDARF